VPRTSPEDFRRGVPAAEYADRLARVRAAMADRGLDALLVSDPANLFYLCGYDAWSFYVPQYLLVPAEGDVQLFARAMDAAGACFTTVLPDAQVHGYPEDLVHRDDRHPVEWLAARAGELGLLGGETLGVEADAAYFTARAYLALAAALPRTRLVDGGELVNWVRVVKSPHEVHQLRVAGTIAERAMGAALDAVRPGRRQCDVVADILAAQAVGTEEHGGDYSAIVPLLPTGAGAGTPHLTWTDRRFVEGEATTIELAGVFGRYHAPLARTVMLGEPGRRLVATAEVVREGMARALDALVPGATGRDVHAAFTEVIGRHGLTKESRIGYSIGIGYPPDWGERTVSLRSEETTVLQAGMAFHVILGMWMDGWGYELSEPVVVTDGPPERLTDVPQDLL
jgi:ectoine hydrolase